jgi:hypothetical protein
MSKKPEKKRRRADILLVLSWLAFIGAQSALAKAEDLPQRIGTIAVPVVLLAAGTYYSFKDRRMLTSLVSLACVGLFVFGFVKGFAGAMG